MSEIIHETQTAIELIRESASGVIHETQTAIEVAQASPAGDLHDTQTAIEIIHTLPIQITTPCPLPAAPVGESYSEQLAASGGTVLPLQWAILSGNLPPGLTMDANGLISGTPTQRGYYQIIVQATNGV